MTTPKNPGPAPPCGPKQVGVVIAVCAERFATRVHEVDRVDASARRSPHSVVPTQTTIQQEAAQRHVAAVGDRKCEPMWRQLRDQRRALHAGLNSRFQVLRIHTDFIQAGEVHQQTSLPKRRVVPVMPAATSGDFQLVPTRKTNRFTNVGFRSRLHDGGGKTRRLHRIPDHAATRLVVRAIPRNDSTLQIALQRCPLRCFGLSSEASGIPKTKPAQQSARCAGQDP